MTSKTTVLYRPVGPVELELIASSGWTRFPPRLAEQPIFYPVLNRNYARQIAQQWNVPRDGAGFVTRFIIHTAFLNQYEVRRVGNREHQEYWIPSEQLDAFNDNIVGKIEVVDQFDPRASDMQES